MLRERPVCHPCFNHGFLDAGFAVLFTSPPTLSPRCPRTVIISFDAHMVPDLAWLPHQAGVCRPTKLACVLLGGPTVLTAHPLCVPLLLILTFLLVLESAVSVENPTLLSGGWWDGVRAQRWAHGVLTAFGLLWAPDRAREYVFVCVCARVRLCVWVCVELYTPMSAHICIFISKLGSLSSHPLFQSNSTGFILAPLSGVCTMRNPGDGRGWHSTWGTALPRFPEAGAHT